MITTAAWRRATTVLATLVLTALPAAGPAFAGTTAPAAAATATHRTLPEPPPVDVARDELADLTVAEPHSMEGYSRTKFPHWAKQYGECDTRVICTAGSGDSRKASGSTAM